MLVKFHIKKFTSRIESAIADLRVDVDIRFRSEQQNLGKVGRENQAFKSSTSVVAFAK